MAGHLQAGVDEAQEALQPAFSAHRSCLGDLVTQEQQQNSNQEKREITGIISIRSKAAIIITPMLC